MLPFVRIGPLLVQLPGLALLAGIWLGMNAVEKEAVRLRLNAPAVLNMIMVGLIAGLLGARFLFALEHINAYLAAPLGLLAFSATALDPWGGLLVGGAGAWRYARRKALPLRPTLDALAPGLAVFLVAVGIANILSGNGYGAESDVPWAIPLWGAYRHPTQIYETLLALGVLLTWKFASAASAASGSSLWQVVGLSAAARVFTEAFHGDSLVVLGGFRGVQVVALAALAVALYVHRRWAPPQAATPDSPSTRRRSAPPRRPVKPQAKRPLPKGSKPTRTRPK